MRIATALLLAPVLAAQTFIVDRGGGGQFTDLPPAIAAVPSGAVLRVRPGTYSPFAIANKSLSILGDSPDTVQIDFTLGDVALGPIAASDRIVVHNLRCVGGIIGGTRLLVQNAMGQVVLDHVTVTAPVPPLLGSPPRVLIQGSTNVHLQACTFLPAGSAGSAAASKCEIQSSVVEMAGTRIVGEPGTASAFGGATPGALALLVSGSTLFLHDTAVVGGAGSPAVGCGLPGASGPSDGGPGCQLRGGSTVDLVGGVIQGGAGGSGLSCRPAGANGGVGADVAASTLRTAGSAPLGGAGGVTGGSPGQAVVLGAGGSVATLTAPAVIASLRGTAGPGQLVGCALRSNPGDLAILLISYDQVIATSPLLTLGALQVLPVLTFGAFTVPAGGVLDVPIPILNTWPLDQWIPFQFVALSPSLTEIWASNSAAILVKS